MRCRIVENRIMHRGQSGDRHFADAGVQVDAASLDPLRGDTQPRREDTHPCQIYHNRWFYPSLGVLVMCACIQTTGWWEGYAIRYVREYLKKSGGDGLEVRAVGVFEMHDLNKDGFLSPEEFEPLAERLMQFNVTFQDSTRYDRNISADEEVLTLDVKFIPLKLETLTKDLSVINEGLDSLSGLIDWTTPVKPWQNFGTRDFKPFLPKTEVDLESIGRVYWIFESSKDRGPSMSSGRYVPPALEMEGEKAVHRLLALFHPLPFVHTRFAPRGGAAVVQAYNEVYVKIVFRIHAEFQLNRPPFYPFWFTPAQFKGHVTISRDASRVLDFHLYVPNDKRLNVDMEWSTGSREAGNLEVDIGYMPQMELSSTAESIPAVQAGVDRRDDYIQSRPDETEATNIIWKEEISVAEAERLIEVGLYPFKQLTYHNFTEGLREATRIGRPIHSILLWGCLDDQSC